MCRWGDAICDTLYGSAAIIIKIWKYHAGFVILVESQHKTQLCLHTYVATSKKKKKNVILGFTGLLITDYIV